jgi:hypothetical protein
MVAARGGAAAGACRRRPVYPRLSAGPAARPGAAALGAVGTPGAGDSRWNPFPPWATLPHRGTQRRTGWVNGGPDAGSPGSRLSAAGAGGQDPRMSMHDPAVVPPVTGERLAWADAPGWLRAGVEARLGGPVVEATTQPGGFSPGLAARLRLGDGRRVFLKAVGPQPNPDSPGIHRAEAAIAAVLPRSVPAPRLLWSLDERGWVALAFEDVEGVHPRLPWRPEELRRVLAMVAELAAALTPAPTGPPAGQGRRPGGGHHRPGRLCRLPARPVPPAAPARPAHRPGLPAGPGPRRPGLAAAADRLALSRRRWVRGRPNFASRGAGPSSVAASRRTDRTTRPSRTAHGPAAVRPRPPGVSGSGPAVPRPAGARPGRRRPAPGRCRRPAAGPPPTVS